MKTVFTRLGLDNGEWREIMGWLLPDDEEGVLLFDFRLVLPESGVPCPYLDNTIATISQSLSQTQGTGTLN